MIAVNERNFAQAFPPALRERYWSELEAIVSQILEEPRSLARDYRQRVEDRPLAEQILAFHEPPIVVAMELAGHERLSADQERMLESLEIGTQKLASPPLVRPPHFLASLVFLLTPKEERRETMRYILDAYYDRQMRAGKAAAHLFIFRQAVSALGGALIHAPVAAMFAALVKLIIR